MNWIYPDKPRAVSESFLRELITSQSDGEYAIQEKIDGWRVLLFVNACTAAWTRHKTPLHEALKREADFSPALTDTLHNLHLPLGLVLDGEFLSSRRGYEGEERLFFFDVLFVEGVYIGRNPYRQRWSILTDLIPTEGLTQVVEEVPAGILRNGGRLREMAEGVVLKAWDSTIIGSQRESAKNPQWFKCVQTEFGTGIA